MKKQLFSALIMLVFFHSNSNCFVLNLLHDVGVICSALTEVNRINRQAAYEFVAGSLHSQENDLDGLSEFLAGQEFDEYGRPITRSIGGIHDLAGDLPPEVNEVVAFLKNHERYAEMGAHMPKGVLLVGPPGTGKTSIARAIAAEANASFFHASGSEFVEVYVGVGPQRVRDLFDNARRSIRRGLYKSAIIFIDEIDAIGGARSDFDNSEYRNTLNELLNQMDGFNQDPSIVVIAATNKPDSLDSALKRPGRFDRIVEISLPNFDNRKKILMHYCWHIKMSQLNDPLDFDILAQKTVGMSPAEIKNLVNEAAINAVRRGDSYVSMENFESVLTTVRRHRK